MAGIEAAPADHTGEGASALDDQVIEGTAEEVAVSKAKDAETVKTEPVPSATEADSDEKTSDETRQVRDGAELAQEPTDGASVAVSPSVTGPAAAADREPRSATLVPDRPPDDPGVAPEDADETEISLERLRAAHIR